MGLRLWVLVPVIAEAWPADHDYQMDKFQFGLPLDRTESQPLEQLADRLRSIGFREREPADETDGNTLREGAKDVYVHRDPSGQPICLYLEYVTEYTERFYGLDSDEEYEERTCTPLGRGKFLLGVDGVFAYQSSIDPVRVLRLLFGGESPGSEFMFPTRIKPARLQHYYSSADQVSKLKLDPSNIEPNDVPGAISDPSSSDDPELADEIQHALALAERITLSTAHYRTRDLSESRAVEEFVRLSEFVELSVGYEDTPTLKLSPMWIGFHLPATLETEQKAETIWNRVQPIWQDVSA